MADNPAPPVEDEEVIETPDDTTQDTPEEEENAVKKDRTRQQIEKLKQHNQELKEERDQYKSLFESSRPVEAPQQAPTPQQAGAPNLTQQQVNDVYQGMVDENGYIDGARLIQALQQADQRSKLAEQKAAQLEQQARQREAQAFQQQEKDAQTRVYAKYPQLDPNGEQFDPKMYQYVYNDLAAKAKRGELPTEKDYMKAADTVYNDLYEGRDMTNKQKEEQTKKTDQKLQINATRPRSSIEKDYFAGVEEDELLKQVQSGKRGAVAALLKRHGQ